MVQRDSWSVGTSRRRHACESGGALCCRWTLASALSRACAGHIKHVRRHRCLKSFSLLRAAHSEVLALFLLSLHSDCIKHTLRSRVCRCTLFSTTAVTQVEYHHKCRNGDPAHALVSEWRPHESAATPLTRSRCQQSLLQLS